MQISFTATTYCYEPLDKNTGQRRINRCYIPGFLKAFDSVPHRRLIHKLKSLGVHYCDCPLSERTMTLAAVGATTSSTIQCPADPILLGGLSNCPLSCQPNISVGYLA